MQIRKQRVYLIDVLRIVFALLIFMRHSLTMGGVNYYWLNDTIKRFTGPVMTGFFIISGYSLFYGYSDHDLLNRTQIKRFYLKRLISVIPVYYLVCVVHWFVVEPDLGLALKMAPVQLLGIQSFWDGAFNVSHNGATWFVSCLLFMYLLYPLVQELIKALSFAGRILVLALLLFVIVYWPWLSMWYPSASNYANPLYRGMEFVVGVIVCSLWRTISEKMTCINAKGSAFFYIPVGSLIILLTAALYRNNIWLQRFQICIMAMIIFTAGFCRSKRLEKSKVLRYLASLGYPFYILQDFIWAKSRYINPLVRRIGWNWGKMLAFFLILFIMSAVIQKWYQEPIRKRLQAKMQ